MYAGILSGPDDVDGFISLSVRATSASSIVGKIKSIAFDGVLRVASASVLGL